MNKFSITVLIAVLAFLIFIFVDKTKIGTLDPVTPSKETLVKSALEGITTDKQDKQKTVEITQKTSMSETQEMPDKYYINPPNVKIIVKDSVGYIDDIGVFLNSYSGALEDLPIDMKVSLGKTLQRCGLSPRGKVFISDDQENSAYFSGINTEKLKKQKLMCDKVDEKLILLSYELLEKTANEGSLDGSIQFYAAQPPEVLAASMKNDFSKLNIEELQNKHLERSMLLLQRSIEKGNLAATLLLANEFYSSEGIVKQNAIKSLAYFLAYNSVLNSKSIQKTINKFDNILFSHEIKLAKKQANDLIKIWEKQEYLTK